MRLRILLPLILLLPLRAAIDPSKDLLVHWGVPDARAVRLLRDAGFSAVLIPYSGDPGSAAFARACGRAGLVPVAELLPADEQALRRSVDDALAAGFVGVALEAFGSEQALRNLLGGLKDIERFVFLKPEQIHWNAGPAHAVLRGGRWPGMTPLDPTEASASAAPWVDANSWLVAWLRAVFPQRPAVLGYRPDEDAGVSKDRVVHYDSLELVLADAFAAGGNAILHLPESHQKALLDEKAQAVAAWKSLAATVRFLKENSAAFQSPVSSRVSAAAGSLEQSGELLNMMYRRNVTPLVVPARELARWAPGRCRVLMAANTGPPTPEGVRRIFEFVRTGGQVLTAPSAAGEPKWWDDPAARLIRSEEDRETYSLGGGRIIAYRQTIADPAEFALDVIDALGMRTRDLRIWAAESVIGILKALPGGKTSLALVNYGSPIDDAEFLVRVEGAFRKATFHEPGASESTAMPVSRRGTGTEISVDHLRRIVVIELE